MPRGYGREHHHRRGLRQSENMHYGRFADGGITQRIDTYASAASRESSTQAQSERVETGLLDDAVSIYQLLPKIDCARCGYASCVDCANAIAQGEAPADACALIGHRILNDVEALLNKNKRR